MINPEYIRGIQARLAIARDIETVKPIIRDFLAFVPSINGSYSYEKRTRPSQEIDVYISYKLSNPLYRINKKIKNHFVYDNLYDFDIEFPKSISSDLKDLEERFEVEHDSSKKKFKIINPRII